MKRFYISILLLIGFVSSYGQFPNTQNIGSPSTQVVARGGMGSDSGFVWRKDFTDTTTANLGFLKNIAGIVIRTGDTRWMRSNDATRWLADGAGSVYVDTSTTVLLFGNGAIDNPITAQLIASGQNNNAVQILSDGVYVPSYVQDGLNSGGIVTWVSGYTYDVSTAQYVINRVSYSAPYTQVTLDNSDPTDDRIDVIVAQTDETIDVITGTPADDPQQPSYDPATQLPLAFILVTAGSTQPTVSQDYIYLNDAEWTTLSSTARINAASTTNPFSPTLDVEGTLVQNGDNIRFTAVTPPTISDFNVVNLKIFSKATWANTSQIQLQFLGGGGSPIGVPVVLANNSYGFSSTQTSSYQNVTIPLSDFGALSSVTAFLMTVSTINGNTIGFYIDNIQLQESYVPTGTNNYIINQNSYIQTANYRISNDGQIGNGDGRIGVNSSPVSASVTAAIKQHSSSILPNNIVTVANNLSQNIMSIQGNGVVSFNSGGASTGLGLLGGANIGYIRSTPANNSINENLLTFHGLSNITKTQNTFNLVTIGSAEGASPIGRFTPTSGTANFVTINVSPYINQTGTASGTTYGVRYNPTVISALGGHVAFSNTYGDNRFNETSGRTLALARFETSKGTDVASANDLTLASNGNVFTITGTTQINAITTSLWQAGSQVQLLFSGAVLVKHNTAGGAGTAPILLAGSTDLTTDANTVLSLVYNGTQWEEMSRKLSGGASITAITANNGLNASTPTNVQLGGTALLSNSSIPTSAFSFTMTSTNGTNTLKLLNNGSGTGLSVDNSSGTGSGVNAITTSGIGVYGQATSGNGVHGYSASGIGVFGQGDANYAGRFRRFEASSTTVVNVLSIERHPNSGSGGVGMGASLDFALKPTTGSSAIVSNTIVSKWVDPTNATVTSTLVITGKNSGSSVDILTIGSTGILTLGASYQGLGAGYLAVSNTGVVSWSAATGSMTNPMTATGSIIYSSDGAGTPAELTIGTNGQVLQVSAGGIPEWVTPGVGGSVTSVAQSFTGGLISVSGSPVTTSGTLALTVAGTSGGVPYFSGASTWASSAELTANAIMIGGGAGAAPSTTTTATGMLTFLGTPSSANLAATVTDETGSGALVFATSPTFTTPVLGTPTSVTLTNATGLPLTTGVTGTLDETNGGTGITSYATGDLPYATGVNTLGKLTATTDGFVLTLSGGVPVWSAAGAGTITAVNGTTNQVNANTVGTVVTLSTPQDIHTSAGPQFNNINLGGTSSANTIGLFVGTTTLTNSGIYNSPIITPAAGASAQVYYSDGDIIEAGSGTHSSLMGANFVPPTVTPGAATVTNTATVYIGGAMTATVTGGNYALWVNGSTKFDILGGTGDRYVKADANGVISATYTIFNPTVQTLTDGATINWTVASGGNAAVTLAGTGRTLSITSPIAGHTYTVRVIQGSGGSKTITTWPVTTKWPGGVAPILSTTAGYYDIIILYYDGSQFYGNYILGYTS